MDLFKAMNISASALSAQRERMNVVASNLANIHTTSTPEGGPYKKKNVVFEAHGVEKSFESHLQDHLHRQVKGVRVKRVIESEQPPQKIFDPSHPDADSEGYVLMPNIDLMSEMVDMISATRSYEANVTAVNASRNMAAKALEIGK
jgi:flagellar basal-body rod protein FlgC